MNTTTTTDRIRPNPAPAGALRKAAPGWVAALAMLALPAAAEPLPTAAREAVERLVQAQTAGLAAETTVHFLKSAALPACDGDYEAFVPRGRTVLGRVSLGLRCTGEAAWTRYIATRVTAHGRYFAAARPIAPGQPLQPGDYVERSGDLSTLPRAVVIDAAMLEGLSSARRIAAGAPLRRDHMRGMAAIRQGQTVQVVARGAGFTVSTEGKAMTRGEVGATVRVRTRDGRLVTGLADAQGRVRLSQ